MKATEVQGGDIFVQDGKPFYRVLEVQHDGEGNVIARVLYEDGGDGARVWGTDQEVPLVREASR
jgi:hypothetical protein